VPRPYAAAGRDVTAAETELRQAIAKTSSALNAATRTVTPEKAAPALEKPAAERPQPTPKASPGGLDLTMPLLALLWLALAAIGVRTVRRTLGTG
jgi:hypothetical protein